MSRTVEVQEIACDLITDNEAFREDIGDLTELIESIQRVGQLHPILVSKTETGYVVLAGRRRLAACRTFDRDDPVRAEGSHRLLFRSGSNLAASRCFPDLYPPETAHS